jgi:hypothetical protein
MKRKRDEGSEEDADDLRVPWLWALPDLVHHELIGYALPTHCNVALGPWRA